MKRNDLIATGLIAMLSVGIIGGKLWESAQRPSNDRITTIEQVNGKDHEVDRVFYTIYPNTKDFGFMKVYSAPVGVKEKLLVRNSYDKEEINGIYSATKPYDLFE